MKDTKIIPVKKQEDGTAVSYGSCKFCGQSFAIETIGEGGDQEILDKHATRMCKCDEAKEWVKIEDSKDKVEKNITELFGADSATSKILLDNIDSVSSGAIAKITVDSGKGFKGTLTTTLKGKLKVEKQVRTTITREVG
ncbi:MAG: hypothetical protein IJV71_03505 [Lachnospiraceae bacterium]|nr:hypothetical protein [Lachnospiraceae bacterium]